MFVNLFIKEIQNYLQTFKFSAAMITTFVLVLASVFVLGEDYNRRRNQYNVLTEHAAQQALDIYVPSRIRPIIHRPPSPLSIFAQGSEQRLGNSVEISRWIVPTEANDLLSDNELMASQPPFDLLAIFTLVISLFGILISYDAVCGEKERGTLKQMCTAPVRRGTIITAKFTAGVAVLAIPFLLSFIGSLLVLQFFHGISYTADQWIAIAVIVLSGMLFGALFIALGLLSSTLMHRSSSSLVFALFIWTVTVLLLPNAANNLAASFTPSLPPTEVSNFIQQRGVELGEKISKWHRENTPQTGGMGSFNVGGERPFLFDGTPKQFNDNIRYVLYYEKMYQQNAEDVYNLIRTHDGRRRAQARLAALLASPSPSTQLRWALTALATTDYTGHERFMERARLYRRTFLNNLAKYGYFGKNALGFFSRRAPEEITEEGYNSRSQKVWARVEAGENIWELVSPKNYPRLSPDHVPHFDNGLEQPRLQDALSPFFVLAVMTILLFLVTFTIFIRYDVR